MSWVEGQSRRRYAELRGGEINAATALGELTARAGRDHDEGGGGSPQCHAYQRSEAVPTTDAQRNRAGLKEAGSTYVVLLRR